MVLSWKQCRVLLLLLLLLTIYCPYSVNSQVADYATANLSTSWTNSPSSSNTLNFNNGSTVLRAILLSGSGSDPEFACGFYCNGACDTYLFAIVIVITYPSRGFPAPKVVWSANRNYLVRIDSTLQLTVEGNLVLRDGDGTVAWSTNTTGRSVAGLNLTETGNLILFDVNNKTVWQSFAHPTDTMLPGQKLVSGQKLTASVSETNWSQGLFSFSVNGQGLVAFIESNPPQAYYGNILDGKDDSKDEGCVEFLNGSLAQCVGAGQTEPSVNNSVSFASSKQFMRLGLDGHLRVYELGGDLWVWNEVADLLSGSLDKCGYPMVCGEFGICSNGGQCSCPGSNNGTSYFKQINDRQPDLGCFETTPLTCETSQYHSFLELKDIAYFTLTFRLPVRNLTVPDIESCKQACLKNCSCKAVLLQYDWNFSSGNCYLQSQIFSLINNDYEKTGYYSSAFLKVQTGLSALAPSLNSSPAPAPREKKRGHVTAIVVSSLGAILSAIGILALFLWKKRNGGEAEEDYLDQLPGMPTRFSYKDLKTMTENFSKKLGEGGFGSVFEGTLSNGVKIAVKRLDGLGQIKRSFLAEVETIGSIHHVNLVRLIGFCAEKSYRLLVYEYMCNGSLDKWIFHKNHQLVLNWQCRREIILDIAKGLAYLHEDCRQKIVHLDIKPQNILLDETFNAKVSDFGLSKLIDKDQSQVMTNMRGTPGYLAPEWLSSVITEKVDVYSYGIVVLEILCGRKNLDRSQPEEQMHLLSVFKKKAEEGQLLDMVDKSCEDMQLHGAEAVELMRVAAWCLQSDFTKRPSMSVVIKVLEGVMDVEHNLDYNFSNPPLSKKTGEDGLKEVNLGAASQLSPSVLTGPR